MSPIFLSSLLFFFSELLIEIMNRFVFSSPVITSLGLEVDCLYLKQKEPGHEMLCDQIRLKPACSATETSKNVADCAADVQADLRLWCFAYRISMFTHLVLEHKRLASVWNHRISLDN